MFYLKKTKLRAKNQFLVRIGVKLFYAIALWSISLPGIFAGAAEKYKYTEKEKRYISRWGEELLTAYGIPSQTAHKKAPSKKKDPYKLEVESLHRSKVMSIAVELYQKSVPGYRKITQGGSAAIPILLR